MPSTTEAKPPKKKLVPVSSDAAQSSSAKPPRPSKRTKKPRAAAPEDDASDAEPDEADAEASTEKPKKRAKQSKASSSKKGSTPDDDAPAPETDEEAEEPAPKKRSKGRAPIDLASAVLQALATNERMNQFLLENLDDRAWNVPPPAGQGRTIAAIFSHMHNVRHMWLTVAAKKKKAPDKLDRRTVTKPQAMKAMAASSQALLVLFEHSLEQGGRVKDFRPDVVGFLGYVIAHEAHHRGQICMLARELGMPLSQEAGYGMWDWNKRWKECGYSG
jgi:uncharacterized damage-inducible protein DinB